MEQKHRIFLSAAELKEFIQDHVTEYPIYMVEIYPRGSYYDLYGSNDCKRWYLLRQKSRFLFELFRDIFKYDESVF